MSSYEWEKGSIKIPSPQWSPFKRSIINYYNQIIDSDYKLALKTYNFLKVAAKGRRNYDYKKAAILKLQELNLDSISVSRIENSLFKESRTTPLKPKRKQFKHITNQTQHIYLEHATIGLSNSTRTFYWDVPEGNHAIDLAHEDKIVKILFNLLENISWKRNSGGIIVANDEVNADNIANKGGNYVTHAYGPLGKNLQTFPQGLNMVGYI